MGYWLRKLLHTESSVPSDGTYRYKLPVTGLYSAFSVAIQATRYQARAEVDSQDTLRDAITKIEMLSEGTKVIKSLRGAELNALNAFDFKRIPPFQHQEGLTDYNMDDLYLLAGRSLQDKEYMFDMSRFADPEIALTNALRQDAARGFGDKSLQYKIYGWRWMGDPVPMPKGYMRADERLYYDTGAAGTIKPLQITTGKRIRRILVKGWEERHTIAGHFSKLELEVDEGAYSPIVADSMMELALQNKVDYNLDLKLHARIHHFVHALAMQFDSFLAYHQSAVATGVYTAATNPLSVTMAGGMVDVVSLSIAEVSWVPHVTSLIADGAGYQRAVLLGFDKEPGLADMLDTKDMGILKLLITETADGDTVSVVVEEEVLY